MLAFVSLAVLTAQLLLLQPTQAAPDQPPSHIIRPVPISNRKVPAWSLAPSYEISLIYKEDDPSARHQYSARVDYTMRDPAFVSSDHQAKIASIKCDTASSATVYFKNKAAMQEATKVWELPVYMITTGPEGGCSNDDDAYNPIHLMKVDEIDEKKLSIIYHAYESYFDLAASYQNIHIDNEDAPGLAAHAVELEKRQGGLSFKPSATNNYNAQTKRASEQIVLYKDEQKGESKGGDKGEYSASLTCTNCWSHGEFLITVDTGSAVGNVVLEHVVKLVQAVADLKGWLQRIFDAVLDAISWSGRFKRASIRWDDCIRDAITSASKIKPFEERDYHKLDRRIQGCNSDYGIKSATGLNDWSPGIFEPRLAELTRHYNKVYADYQRIVRQANLIASELRRTKNLPPQLAQLPGGRPIRRQATGPSDNKAKISVRGDMAANMDVLLQVNGKVESRPIEKKIGKPVTFIGQSWQIPYVISIGPRVQLSAIGSLGFEGAANISTGMDIRFDGFSADLELANIGNMQTKHIAPRVFNWHKPQLNLTKAAVQAKVGIKVDLTFVVDLDIAAHKAYAGFGTEASLVNTLTYGDEDCSKGVQYDAALELAIDGSVNLGSESPEKKLCKNPKKLEFSIPDWKESIMLNASKMAASASQAASGSSKPATSSRPVIATRSSKPVGSTKAVKPSKLPKPAVSSKSVKPTTPAVPSKSAKVSKPVVARSLVTPAPSFNKRDMNHRMVLEKRTKWTCDLIEATLQFYKTCFDLTSFMGCDANTQVWNNRGGPRRLGACVPKGADSD